MNITISIDKIKSLLEQLKDAADKTDVIYPKGTPGSVIALQQKNIAKAADISEQILDEAEALTLFFNAKVEATEAPEKQVVTDDAATEEPTTNEA